MGIIQLIFKNLLMTCLVNGIDVILDTQQVYRVVNPKFINVAIDTGVVKNHWENFRPKSTRVKTLAAGLAPCYLRVGGTEADFLIFQNDKTHGGKLTGGHVQMKQNLKANLTDSRARNRRDVGFLDSSEPLTNFTMTASFYDQIHKFVSSVGWDLIFDLNSLLRKPTGAWDPSNAMELINYTAQSGYKMGGWELGNEPDEYTGGVIKHKLVTPEQLAKDFENLRTLVRSYPTFRDCQILGPSIAAMSVYWREGFFYSKRFLAKAGQGKAYTASRGGKLESQNLTFVVLSISGALVYHDGLVGENRSNSIVCFSGNVWEGSAEPNAYYHKTGYRVEPGQLAKDFVVLHKLLGHYSQFAYAQLLGPSVTQLNKKRTDKYFKSFLSAGGGDVVTAATFHQYYEDGAITKVEDFYNPDILNILYEEIQTGVNLTRAAGSSAKVWLGETSSAWRGGAPNISDRYVACFAWLDKLGMSARDGIDALIRQTFYGGHYALLDHETLDPNPDYWLTLLYNLLVGNRVLRVTSPDSSGKLRVYAHCTETVNSRYPRGSVTVYLMNLGEYGTTFEFPQFGSDLHVYNMSPPDNDLTSQSVTLNGILLQLKDDRTLPNLLYPVKTTDFVVIDAKTFSFIVIPDAKLSICM